MDAPSNTNPKFTFVFASTNRGKLNEVQQICASLDWVCIDPQTLIDDCGPMPEVEEGTESYRANARLKAEAFHRWCRHPVIGDDTGLEVDALNGAPGIKSARYAGINATMPQNKEKLLHDLQSATDRRARFRSVLCLVNSQDPSSPYFAEATLEGAIRTAPQGSGGFGYDDLFEVAGHNGTTLAALKEKCFRDTHRYLSFLGLRKIFLHPYSFDFQI